MILPKYQWLIENKGQNCSKFCDRLYVDSNYSKKFQVSHKPNIIIDENFDGNNINNPLDLDEYVFDATHDPLDKEYVNSYTFTYNGQSYCYIFCYDIDIVGFKTITQYGNFYLVKLYPTLGALIYIQAVNEYMSQYGISALISGTDIIVSGLPLGTQVDIAVTGNYPTTSGITENATWGLNNFLPIDGKACFFNISSLEIQGATSTPSIFYDAVIQAKHRVKCTVQFVNSFGYDVDLDFIIRNNNFQEIETQTKTAQTGTNTLEFCFMADASPPPYYVFEFLLSDQTAYISSIVNEKVGFCYTNVLIEEIGYLDQIDYIDCTGEQFTFVNSDWISISVCGYNELIEITESLPNEFQLILTGSDDSVIYTKWYQQIIPGECKYGQLMRFRWTDTCRVGDLDYTDESMRFTNELYVTGVLIKQGLDKVEAIGNITSSGRKTSVYRHTIEQYELRLHPYTAETQQAFERAFEHATIYIDNDEYYLGDGSFYSVSEIDQFIYTGRIDLYLAGSEVIKSSCCC